VEISYLDPAVLTFVVIPVLLVAALVWAAGAALSRGVALVTAVLAIAWLTVTWALADSGVLQQWDRRPPPFALLVPALVAISVALAVSPFGRRFATEIPLWVLVGVQGFRLPLELAMHEMANRGVMPEQMTYTGRNFDIVTGATAIVVAWLLRTRRASAGLALIWNVVGLGLVVNVVIVAILATPMFRYFGDDSLNTWVTYPPFVWLPTVMVTAALAGHFLVFRALRVQA